MYHNLHRCVMTKNCDQTFHFQFALARIYCPLAGFGTALCLITGRGQVIALLFVKHSLAQLRVLVSHMTLSFVNKYKFTGSGFTSDTVSVLPQRGGKKRKLENKTRIEAREREMVRETTHILQDNLTKIEKEQVRLM